MITVKQGDTHPIEFRVNTDLTGATCRLIARRQDNCTPVILPIASIVSQPTESVVTHNLTGTLDPVRYWVELEATKGGIIATAPTDGYEVIRVVREID